MTYFCGDSLAGYATAPQFKFHNLYDLPVSHIAIKCNEGKDSGLASPEKDALEFYGMNHLAAIVRKNFTPHEPLSPLAKTLMQEYLSVVTEQGVRMVKYVLLIITRESRHIKHKSDHEFWKGFEAKFGKTAKSFNFKIRDKGPDGTATFFIEYPPQLSLGQHVEAIDYIFNQAGEGGFNGGFGGAKWGVISTALLNLIKGELTIETFLDTAFTLAHNGGPIFNKSMFYSHWDQFLYKILDVQRSGQIPELFVEGSQKHPLPLVAKLVEQFKQAYPGEIGEYVDWFKVFPVDKNTNYNAEQAKQKQLYGGGAKTAKGEKIIGNWEVYPGQTVQIIQRKKAA